MALGRGPSFLPPMEEWYSGLLPYRFLLPAQVVIVLLLMKVCLDFTRGRGFFAAPRRALANGLLVFGALYLAVMVIRYALRMALYPAERWTGGSIPIFVHWVLASFLLAVGGYHRRRTRGELRPPTYPLARAARSLGALLVAAAVLSWVFVQIAPSYLARRLGIRRAEYAVRVERSASLTTSDGVRLVSTVSHPQRAGTTPTILVRIALPRTLKNLFFAGVLGRMWAERGYTSVIQVSRGRRPSGGEHYPLRGERRDGIETLAWLSKQPWFDGRLGLWGGSSSGHSEWVIADQTEPGPSALIVWLASSDFHGMFYPGGAFSLQSALFWAIGSRGSRDAVPEPEVLDRGIAGFPLIEADDRAVADIPFFDDWVRHRERDAYWEEVERQDQASRLGGPALLMAGWYDPFLPTQLKDYERIRRDAALPVSSASRLIIGPWAHAETVTLPGNVRPRNFRLESLAPSVAWFDRHLRGDPLAPDLPPVRIFVMGRNVWRDETEWPLARARDTPYYLRSRGRANGLGGDGELSVGAPASEEPADSFVYDPRNPAPSAGGAMLGPRSGIARQNAVEARPDVLVYETDPLTTDLEVTGPIRLVLYVSTTAPETDFTGKLVDVYPDGSAYNVSEGILRRRYAGHSETAEIEIEMWTTSMVFLEGHRIRLEVSSSNYPRFDRNPNTGGDTATETRPVAARQRIHHGRGAPSRLILPIVPGI